MRFAYAMTSLGVLLLVLALMMPSVAQDGAAAMQMASLAETAEPSAVERIQDGEILDCPGCNFTGLDLAHTCVKEKNLAGARFDDASALYMCMSYANFSGASFRNTDLTGANLAHADLSGADLSGAKLDITSLLGADLSTAKGLTQAQLDVACADETTKLPDDLIPRSCS